MSASRDELSVRKELLVAQSALYRAQLRCEALAFHACVSRGSSWIAWGLTAVSIVRTLLAIVSIFRK